MKLADTNVWLALSVSNHEHHSNASVWMLDQTEEGSVVFCRQTQLSLLRLLTTRGVVEPYRIKLSTNQKAWELYNGFQADPRVSFASEPDGLDRMWQQLSRTGTPSPKLWVDSYLAAFAICGDYQLVTFDAEFRQFSNLDVIILR